MPYIHHPHRRQSKYAHQKSQWTISQQEELAVYQNSINNNWLAGVFYWGLHLQGNAPQQLGVYKQPSSFGLKIAKFVGDQQNNWHGYPVAHWLSPWDKPTDEVLMKWKDAGIINKAKMAKIHKGKNAIRELIHKRGLLGFPDLLGRFDVVWSGWVVEQS